MASERNTSSNAAVNLLSRSWIRNRIGSVRSTNVSMMFRACWVAHFGKGWNSVSLYLENGERVAIRARQTGKVYDHVNVYRGSIRPLGPVVLGIRTARDVARFERELKKWLALPGTGP